MTMAMMARVVNFKDYALGTMNLVGRIMSMLWAEHSLV